MQHPGLRTEQKTEQALALQSLTVILIVLVDTPTRITEEINLPIGHVLAVKLESGQNPDRILLVNHVPICQTILKPIILRMGMTTTVSGIVILHSKKKEINVYMESKHNGLDVILRVMTNVMNIEQ